MKNYFEIVEYLFNQLPYYQKIGNKALKHDLNNITSICSLLDNPQNKFKTIHIAGTNGKGSVSHMISSILQENGLKVGLYTSPHLIDFRERIKINEKKISKQNVVEYVTQYIKILKHISPSFFEYTVAMAFQYFAHCKVDIAIIETGLGGRLDSTNIIQPILSVITNVGLDHTHILGNTLELIATEKAGIIKYKIPIVIGKTQSEIKSIFCKTAVKNKSKIYFADEKQYKNYFLDLKGNYQKSENLRTVLQIVEILLKLGYNITEQEIKKGLSCVIQNTGIQGRWQVFSTTPFIVLDVAHNVDGLKYTMNQFLDVKAEKKIIVFGVVNDKDIQSIITVLPKNITYYLCSPTIFRAMSIEKLSKVFEQYNFTFKSFKTPIDAVQQAIQDITPNDALYIGGSTFVVSDVMSFLNDTLI